MYRLPAMQTFPPRYLFKVSIAGIFHKVIAIIWLTLALQNPNDITVTSRRKGFFSEEIIL